ncbi:hypothetical protein NC652_006570 [Populus alba x Populus x berolinensis]|nr:hypothetical protein NC652_006570 [Populus alba x Populus x berolinensis]
MPNLSRALDVIEDKDKAFFDFNKLTEAFNVAEEEKGRRQGGEKQREVRFYRFQVVFLKEICNEHNATSKDAAIECLFLGVTMFFLKKNKCFFF